ncbi:MAG: hypothetical protein METHAR1v1_280017 [Methanothrix sp.]|nr:MAG: hypothetical protein METHAR1v1_280017 [Methanothrix sp.]
MLYQHITDITVFGGDLISQSIRALYLMGLGIMEIDAGDRPAFRRGGVYDRSRCPGADRLISRIPARAGGRGDPGSLQDHPGGGGIGYQGFIYLEVGGREQTLIEPPPVRPAITAAAPIEGLRPEGISPTHLPRRFRSWRTDPP